MVGCCRGASEAVGSRDGGGEGTWTEKRAGAKMVGSGTGGSRRAVTPAEGWSRGFASAPEDLLVWAEPRSVAAGLGHVVSVLHGYQCPSVPWFWEGDGIALESCSCCRVGELRSPPSSNYPAISSAHEVLHTRKINRCCWSQSPIHHPKRTSQTIWESPSTQAKTITARSSLQSECRVVQAHPGSGASASPAQASSLIHHSSVLDQHCREQPDRVQHGLQWGPQWGTRDPSSGHPPCRLRSCVSMAGLTLTPCLASGWTVAPARLP